MIHRDAQTAFLRCVFPKRRNPRRIRNRYDLPYDLPSEKRILTAKTARKTDDFPKRLHSPRGTRAGDDRVPTHIMLRAALKHRQIHNPCASMVPTHIMLRAALKLNVVLAEVDILSPNTHHAACGIETRPKPYARSRRRCPNTHHAACGIETSSKIFCKTHSSSQHTSCCVRH